MPHSEVYCINGQAAFDRNLRAVIPVHFPQSNLQGILSDFVAGFASANRTKYPFLFPQLITTLCKIGLFIFYALVHQIFLSALYYNEIMKI